MDNHDRDILDLAQEVERTHWAEVKRLQKKCTILLAIIATASTALCIKWLCDLWQT